MPFLSGFNYRKAIKIATAGIPSSSLTAFPKLFMISGDTDIGAELSSQKLAVTLADGTTQVPYGALYFNSSGGSATLKIRAKFDLSSSLSNGDTIGYLYYDSTATDQSNKSGVFTSDVKAYLPLDDNNDWTSNANNATPSGSPTVGTGQVGNGQTFGTSKYLSLPVDFIGDWVSGPPDLTFSLLFKTTSGNSVTLFGQQNNTPPGTADGWVPAIYIDGYGQVNASIFYHNNTNTTASVNAYNDGNWHQVDVTFSGGTETLVIDGGVETITRTSLTQTFYASNYYYFLAAGKYSIWPAAGISIDGTDATPVSLDEFVAKSGVVDSANWIGYRYTDQFSNSSTFTLGAQETAGGSTVVFLIGGGVGISNCVIGS